jgi:hypothetical protein
MRMNHGGQLSRFALDANLPLLRPDSIVRPMTDGLWGLYTPSSWPDRDTEFGYVIAFGTKEELVAELESLGTVNSYDGKTYQITLITLDPEWWIHRAEDGMIPQSIVEGKT